jgi:phosphate transport system ATP-binding protein
MYDRNIALSVNNLNVRIKNSFILNDINLAFKKNQITTIVGPSGSGKSTLLRSLNRINDNVENYNLEGNIYVENQDIYSNNIDVQRLRSKIGMVFQKPCIFPGSIEDNILFGARFKQKLSRSEKTALVKSTLISVDLWDQVRNRLNSKATQLSVGQQQKLCIGRTLAMNPDIILLDEPTSSLDPLSSQAIEDLMMTLKKQFTIICVTHNLEQAKKISDTIILMISGRIVEVGCKSDILNNPSLEITREYFRDYYSLLTEY